MEAEAIVVVGEDPPIEVVEEAAKHLVATERKKTFST